jgi:hypothetical protein
MLCNLRLFMHRTTTSSRGKTLILVLLSLGGRPPNDQYLRTLGLLLRRLGIRCAVIPSALVASATVCGVRQS